MRHEPGDPMVTAVQPPGRIALVSRAFAAMIVTGILSALLIAVGTSLVFSVMPNQRWTVGKLWEFTLFIWFYGSFVATGSAILFGLFVEWPKAWWQARRGGGRFGVHLLISIAAAEALLVGWTAVSAVLDHTPTRERHLADPLLFAAAAAAVGAACSATLWWRLVVLPMRRGRS